LAHNVCLLIVQLHIDTKKHAEALKLINYIENQFLTTGYATNILTNNVNRAGHLVNETKKKENVKYLILLDLLLIKFLFSDNYVLFYPIL